MFNHRLNFWSSSCHIFSSLSHTRKSCCGVYWYTPCFFALTFLYAFGLKRIDGSKFLFYSNVCVKNIKFRLEIYLHLSCIKQIASRLSKTISYKVKNGVWIRSSKKEFCCWIMFIALNLFVYMMYIQTC